MTGPVRLPMSSSGRSAEDVAREAVLHAGEIQKQQFRQLSIGTRQKSPADVVTDVDIAIEKDLRALLTGEFPNFGFLGEETGGSEGKEGFTWTVDPIDGTANFALGIPHFCTTVALLHDGVPVLGITHDAMRDDTFFATAGGGFTINGAPAVPAYESERTNVTLGFDIGPDQELNRRSFETVRALMPLHRVRLMGSSALGFAYAAAGWYDAYFHLSLKPWDVAAGLLFLSEALDGRAVSLDENQQPATPWSTAIIGGSRELVSRISINPSRLGWRS